MAKVAEKEQDKKGVSGMKSGEQKTGEQKAEQKRSDLPDKRETNPREPTEEQKNSEPTDNRPPADHTRKAPTSQEASAQEGVSDSKLGEPEPLPVSDFERQLGEGLPTLHIPEEYAKTFGMGANPRDVGNVPAMYKTAWPSLPKFDNGFSLSDVRRKGFAPISPDMVSTRWSSDKLFLPAFEVVDNFVVVGGSILCMGHREPTERRRQSEIDEHERRTLMRGEMLREVGVDVEDNEAEAEYTPLAFRN